ncbi:MAG: hypothetical protein IJJ91_10745 [Synergistaceae bacterium]|nr:hypothetical protein [Synergistaceae bacterium]
MNHFRDYRKSILPAFDHDAFMRIITTPPSVFDAKEASRRAAEKLLKQGLDVDAPLYRKESKTLMDEVLLVEAALDVDSDGYVSAKNLYEWIYEDKSRYPKWLEEYIRDNIFAERDVDYVSVDGVYMLSPSFAVGLAGIPQTDRGDIACAYLAGVRRMFKPLSEERQKLCMEQAKGEGAREALSDVLVRLLREREPAAEESGEDDETL